ncbi:hypothetical protein LTR27_005921 [Elasticomyces elasticus]|nr:hypothetical protein LTR27_005921 [Elasticomyces elasticus]
MLTSDGSSTTQKAYVLSTLCCTPSSSELLMGATKIGFACRLSLIFNISQARSLISANNITPKSTHKDLATTTGYNVGQGLHRARPFANGCRQVFLVPSNEDWSSSNNCVALPDNASPTHDAGHRLTSVFELLEQVLLEMDMKDILLAQRVNTSFASTIANSKPIQQVLFFAPLDHPDNTPIPNTLLFEQSILQRLPLFLNGSDEKRIAGHCEDGGDRLIMKGYKSGMSRNNDETWQKYVHLTMYFMSDPRQKPDGDCSILPSGSWERMFLSQPPCPCHLRGRHPT